MCEQEQNKERERERERDKEREKKEREKEREEGRERQREGKKGERERERERERGKENDMRKIKIDRNTHNYTDWKRNISCTNKYSTQIVEKRTKQKKKIIVEMRSIKKRIQ